MDTKPMYQLSRVYEDFEPTSDWEHDVEHDTLLVYLPGFRKDQLTVQVTSAEKLRILGERPVGENKLSRFKKEFPISSKYDLNKISAKFEKGILHVKHHKKINGITPAAEQHQPANPSAAAETSGSQKPPTKLPRPPMNEQTHKTDQQFPSKINPDDQIANGDTLKSPEKDRRTKNIDDGLAEAGQKQGTNTAEKNGNVGGDIIDEKGMNSDSGKCTLGGYKKALANLMAEMKQPRQSASFVMATLLVLLIGMYAKTAFRFHGEAEN